jgi:NAD(P)-dependent dehydrogenase (short-subunit alcohol dehydrogenase family)
MNGSLEGRTAIVTGASRGIGLAIAKALMSAGAAVVITSRKEGVAERVAAALGDHAYGVRAHVSDESAARACMRTAVDRFGAIDILVNNAGTNPGFGQLMDVELASVAKTVDINLMAPLLWSRLVWEEWMRDHGGAIINVASVGGLEVRPNLGGYNASKAALIHLTRHLAVELAPSVRVNALAPGVVRTRLAEALWKEQEQAVAASTPLGRIGEPQDIGPAAVFLAGDGASWITGETIVIDGGRRFAGNGAGGRGGEQ